MPRHAVTTNRKEILMSADNSICVLKSKGANGRPEYRVAHVQNLEMATYDANPTARDEYLVSEFGKCVVHRQQAKAWKQAERLYKAEYYVEYGMVLVDIGRRFPGSTDASATGQAATSVKAAGKRRKRPSKMQRQVNSLTRRVAELEKALAARA